jgi:hypothetical protein
MAEPSVTAGTAVATGLTIFGISTGLDPAILIAGLAGGLWAQSYHPPASIWRRVALVALAAILAGYLAPAFAALAASSETVRGIFTLTALQLPVAVLIGLTSHRVLGPAFMRFAAKKAEAYAK